jgi:hypothetical protein
MKKYISSILLITFTLQLCSCYYYKDLTYEEFSSKPNIDDVFIKYDKNQMIHLSADSTINNFIKWKAEPDTLKIFSTYTKGGISHTTKVYNDTLILQKNQISSILIDEYSATLTLVWIVACVAIVALIVYAIHEWKSELNSELEDEF